MNPVEHDLIVSLHQKNAIRMEQYAFRVTGDEELAQDMVQETFLIAVVKIDIVAGHPNPDAWLFKTLHYIIKREMDLGYRKAEIPLESADIFLNGINPDSRLEEILPRSLSESERELLILRFEKQWDYDTIAEYKGIKAAACRKQVSRAMRHFKKDLGK